MGNKYIIKRPPASGLETVAEIPALEGNKVDMSWLPVVGIMGSAIIERGDNANGNYVRWADGTQVCWGNKTITLTSSVLNGIYKMTYDGAVFPAAFTDSPACSISVDWSTQDYAWANCHRRNPGSFNFSVYSLYAFTEKNIGISYLAIGRWK